MDNNPPSRALLEFQEAVRFRKLPNDSGLEQAIEHFGRAIEFDPKFTLAYAEQSLAYLRYYVIHRNLDALEHARADSQAALAIDPDLIDAQLAEAAIFEYTGDEQGALEVLSNIPPKQRNLRALLWLGDVYTRLNRWDEANAAYYEAVRQYPGDWTAQNQLGWSLDLQGRYHEALAHFREASRLEPASALAASNVGNELLQIGLFKAGEEILSGTLTADPSSFEAAVLLSLARRYLNDSPTAILNALNATNLNPAQDEGWGELGEAYLLAGDDTLAQNAFGRASEEVNNYLKWYPGDGPGWMLLALYELKCNRSQGVMALVAKAELFHAKDVPSQLFKARILVLVNNEAEALKVLGEVFEKTEASDTQFAAFADMARFRRSELYLALPGVIKKAA
jgi:tetratricopeptide (TPR) repeat protein